MAKNILKMILKIIIFIVIYLLQIYVINITTLFGVTGDLVLMAIVLTSLMSENKFVYATAVICGIVSDLLFSTVACKYLVIYVLVVSVLIGLKKMYKQDSKMAIIIFSIVGTVICEILEIVFYIMSSGQLVNIFAYMLLILKESIINIFLAFVVYLALRLCSKEG